MIINNKEINNYDDYQQLNGNDIIAFMKDKPAEDIMEFKTFCSTPKITSYADGSKKERKASFFEIRNWVLDKYSPGIRTPKNIKRVGNSLIDKIMEL